MKDAIARVVPIVFGVLLGWVIFHPPDFLRALGPARFLVTGGLAVIALLGFVGIVIGRNLPERVRLTPLPETQVPPPLLALGREFEALGFARTGAALEVAISPPAVMVAFLHAGARAYGAAYRTTTLPPVTGTDIVSILEGERGGLTTNPDWRGATLPAGAGELRQVLPGADLPHLFEAHTKAAAFLRTRGLRCRELAAADFERDFTAAIARQRRTFLASPLRNAAIAIWRSATRSTPHVGPLETQACAQRQLRELLTGRRG